MAWPAGAGRKKADDGVGVAGAIRRPGTGFWFSVLVTSFSLGTAYLYWLNQPPAPARLAPEEAPESDGDDSMVVPAPFRLPPSPRNFRPPEAFLPASVPGQDTLPAGIASGSLLPAGAEEAASPAPAGSEGFEARYPVGAGRVAGKLRGGMGWRLLDSDGKPVVDTVFRRMYHQAGFVDGKMKVKMGEEFFFIDPSGRRVAEPSSH